MQFKWDKWLQGAVISGLLAVVAIAPGITSEGITKLEAWAMLSVFIGGIALFCKNHPPNLDD